MESEGNGEKTEIGRPKRSIAEQTDCTSEKSRQVALTALLFGETGYCSADCHAAIMQHACFSSGWQTDSPLAAEKIKLP